MYPRFSALIVAIASLILVSACQTPQTRGGFTRTQAEMLREQGFVETDEGWQLSLADRLLFDVDSSDLRPEMQANIARVARGLISVGISSARVEGHTDATGTSEYNQGLSFARAQTVATVMQMDGLHWGSLAVRGWGETRPIADNGTDAGRAENRRVVIIVTAL